MIRTHEVRAGAIALLMFALMGAFPGLSTNPRLAEIVSLIT
jgi:hypothetical protein